MTTVVLKEKAKSQVKVNFQNTLIVNSIRGRLGSNPEVKQFKSSNRKYVEFSIAQDNKYSGEKTNWIRVRVIETEKSQVAQTVNKNLTKGSLIELSNVSIEAQAWIDKASGEIKQQLVAAVFSHNQIDFLSIKK